MTKAERRKRSRQRAKERERQAASGLAAVTITEGAQSLSPGPSSPPIATAPVVRESEFITGPIAPPAPAARAPVMKAQTGHMELPPGVVPPVEGEFDDSMEDGEDDQQDDELDDEAQDESDDDGPDDGDDDDDDETEDAEDEAIFNAACGAVEQGDAFTWNELIGCLCEAEVSDPRLGLLVALLVEQDEAGLPLKLTGERVLKVLTDLELGDIVEEAREVATLAPGEEGESPEEQAIVRTTARELREQAQGQLASPPRSTRPLKASQLKARQTALGGAIPVAAGKPERRAGR